MSAKTSYTGPSKDDLLRAISCCDDEITTPELIRLRKEEEEAEDAYEKFLKNNKDLLRLEDAKDKAQRALRVAERKSKEERNKAICKARHAVFTKGATEATIKMVEDLMQE